MTSLRGAGGRGAVGFGIVAGVFLLGCGVKGGGKGRIVVPVAAVEAKPIVTGPAASSCAKTDESLGAEEAFGKRVHGICFAGVAPEMAKDLRAYVHLREGDVLTSEKLQSELRALHDSGFFHQVEATAQPHGVGIELHLRFEPNPVVSSLEITGAPNLDASAVDGVKEVLKPGTVLPKNKLEDEIAKLRAVYADRGFDEAKITGTLTATGDGKTSSVRLVVVEGVRTQVGAITLMGTTKVRAPEAKKALALAPGAPFGERAAEAAANRLTRLYVDRGFVGTEVHVDRGTRQADGTVPIMVVVREGALAKIGRISMKGPDPSLEAELTKLLRVRTGDPFDKPKLNADLERMRDVLRTRKPRRGIRLEWTVDPSATVVNVEIETFGP